MKKLRLDRRSARSENIYEALNLQLRASASRAKFSALVLADESGLVVAWAGNHRYSEEMAAISPMLASKPEGEKTLWRGNVRGKKGKVRFTVASFYSPFGPLYLSATGGQGEQTPTELKTSGLGVLRILK